MTPEEAKNAREKLVAQAKELVGSPYAYGGIGPSSFDCSGFVYYAARNSVKIQLPRTASAIYDFCTIIEDDEMEEGDLVFFKTTGNGKISHVGIYIGGGDFISAISDGQNTGVQVRSLLKGYWADAYYGTGQILPSAKQKSQDEKKTEEKKEQRDLGKNTEDEKKDSHKGNKTVTKAPKSNKEESGILASCLIDGCTIKSCCF